jgi:hypothetical protein
MGRVARDPIESWRDASEEDVEALARDWAEDLECKDEGVQGAVVMMNFTAPPHIQWKFILEAVALAQTKEQLGALAAGPMEHLLGHHGDDYVEKFEQRAAADSKFARAVTGMWQYMISNENWRRIEAVQRRFRQ